jgi:hypothetical protein
MPPTCYPAASRAHEAPHFRDKAQSRMHGCLTMVARLTLLYLTWGRELAGPLPCGVNAKGRPPYGGLPKVYGRVRAPQRSPRDAAKSHRNPALTLASPPAHGGQPEWQRASPTPHT